MKTIAASARTERIAELVIFLLLLGCYSYFFPRWADPNQNSRLDMVVAAVEDGTFRIDRFIVPVRNTVDYAHVGEHYYSDKAPGIAWLGIPVYAGMKAVLDLPFMDRVTERLGNSKAFQATLRESGSGVLKEKVRFALAQVMLSLVISVLPAALLGVLLYRWLAQFTPALWPRLTLVLGYGLLTPVFAYANTFYGHQLSAVMLFAAFYWVSTAKPPLSTKALIGVGALIAYAVVTETPAALISAGLYLYTLYILYRQGQWQRIGWVTGIGILIALTWMSYNYFIFGGPLEFGYKFSELWHNQHDSGFMSLSMPRIDALWGITFGLFRGLFVLSPLLLLSVPGFALWWRSGEQRALWVVCLSSVLAFLTFNSSSSMWWGGFAIGPRYLLPALPFLAVSIIFVFRAWGRHTWLRMLSALLFAWSLVATWSMTLAEQAFPSDAIRDNPFVEFALPNWLVGNIARNLGTLMGFSGEWSLLPLALVVLLVVGGAWFAAQRSPASTVASSAPAQKESAVISR